MILFQVIKSGSSGNAYILSNGETNILIEAGVSIREINQKCGYKKIAACLITHEHNDHAKYALEIAKSGIPLCLSQGTATAKNIDINHRVNIIQAGRTYKINNISFAAFQSLHDAQEPLFFLFRIENKNILFATDTATMPEVPNMNYAFIECNYDSDILNENIKAGCIPQKLANRIIFSHFSISDCETFFKKTDKTKLAAVVLLHLSSRNSDSDNFKERIETITERPTYIAREGLILKF